MYISAFLIVFPPTSRLPGHSSTLTRSSVRRAAAEGIPPAAAAAAAQAAPPASTAYVGQGFYLGTGAGAGTYCGGAGAYWRAAGWRGGRSCLVASGHGGTEEGVAWVGQLDA